MALYKHVVLHHMPIQLHYVSACMLHAISNVAALDMFASRYALDKLGRSPYACDSQAATLETDCIERYAWQPSKECISSAVAQQSVTISFQDAALTRPGLSGCCKPEVKACTSVRHNVDAALTITWHHAYVLVEHLVAQDVVSLPKGKMATMAELLGYP